MNTWFLENGLLFSPECLAVRTKNIYGGAGEFYARDFEAFEGWGLGSEVFSVILDGL